MNSCYNIIPTPQRCNFEEGGRIRTEKVHSELPVTGALEAAIDLLEGQIADRESADVIITGDMSVLTEAEKATFGNKNADTQGYVLKKDENGPVVIVSMTALGAAYGLMTLLQILDQPLKAFSVCDWPDFRYRGNKWLIFTETNIWSYDFGDGIEAYRQRIIRKLDMCLRFKINMVYFDGFGPDPDRTPHYKELMQELNRQARKRGIHLIYGAYTMGYGLSAHGFGKFYGKVYRNMRQGQIYDCMGTYIKDPERNDGMPYITGRSFGTCISNGELMDAKLEELCDYIRQVQPGGLYLHNMDSHLIHPVLWNARCDECRRRWPNDDLFARDGMAGAFAEFFDRLNSGLQSVKTEEYDAAVELLIFNVSPGYMWYIMEDEELETTRKFWYAVQKYSKVKKNVIPLFRELFFNHEDDRMRLPEIVAEGWDFSQDFGIVNFSGGDGFYSDKLFFPSSVFNYMFKGANALITCCGNAFQEPLQIFNAEYMWNSEGSGFYNLPARPENDESFMKLYLDSQKTLFRPEEIYGEGGMLDVICEKLYGVHGHAMAKVFKLTGENGECVVPYACSKETMTAGLQVLIRYRWDNPLSAEEIAGLTRTFGQILELNRKALEILEQEKNEDVAAFREMLEKNTVLIAFWHRYLQLYPRVEACLQQGGEALLQSIDTLLSEVAAQLQSHLSSGYCFADDMQGALARREGILETQQYNLELMKKSILTGERIPADRENLEKGEWW